MKTLIATAGAIADASTKLLPGRYALAFKAATTGDFALDQGTLTIDQRLDQTAKFQTAAATAAALEIDVSTVVFTLTATTPGIAGNQITFQAAPVFSPTGEPITIHTTSQGGDHLAIRANYDSHQIIQLASDALEDDNGDPFSGSSPRQFLPNGTHNGKRSWKWEGDAGQVLLIQFQVFGQTAEWSLRSPDGQPEFFRAIFGTSSPIDEAPDSPDLTSIVVNEGTLTNPVFTTISPAYGLLDAALTAAVPQVAFTDNDDGTTPLVPIPVTPLTGGADATITEETVIIPLLADVAPGSDALSYDLSVAAQRRAHLEFVVAEPASLLITLAGGNTTGALHISCNPINP